MSWGRIRCPAPRRSSPARTSSATWMTFSPGATGLSTSIDVSSAGCVLSTITTESAPSASVPPVYATAASPTPMPMLEDLPVGMSATTSKRAGRLSDAPYVSLARTEKPSIEDLGNAGRFSGEWMSWAITRSRACSVFRFSMSETGTRWGSKSWSACSGDRTLKKSGTVRPHQSRLCCIPTLQALLSNSIRGSGRHILSAMPSGV